MLINLWVRKKSSGRVHQVGTDVHDSLELLDGQVQYVNMQNTCSTLCEYEWVEAPDLDDYVSVTPEELWINRKLLHKDAVEVTRRMLEERGKCAHTERRTDMKEFTVIYTARVTGADVAALPISSAVKQGFDKAQEEVLGADCVCVQRIEDVALTYTVEVTEVISGSDTEFLLGEYRGIAEERIRNKLGAEAVEITEYKVFEGSERDA